MCSQYSKVNSFYAISFFLTDAGVYIQLFLLQRQTSGVPGHSGASVSSETGSTCFKVIVNCLDACICAVCVS